MLDSAPHLTFEGTGFDGVGSALGMAAVVGPDPSFIVSAGGASLFDVPGAIYVGAGPDSNTGEVLAALGDLTGDGLDDLGFSADTAGDPYRSGLVWVVPGSLAPVSGPSTGLPDGVAGSFEGAGVGYGVAGGDVTGDGQADLVVGAPSVYPAWGTVPGTVRVFPGPFSGMHDFDDGPLGVSGEYDGDLFGFGIETTDADDDGRQDLLVGAPGYPAFRYEGAIYLISGAALDP